MNVLFRCVDIDRSGAWVCFHFRSQLSGDTGPDCPQSDLKLYVTNPAFFQAFDVDMECNVDFLGVIREGKLIEEKTDGDVTDSREEAAPGVSGSPGRDQPEGGDPDGPSGGDLGIVFEEGELSREESEHAPQPSEEQADVLKPRKRRARP